MKTMACRQLGGSCDAPYRGETADEVIKAQDRHLREMAKEGDATHEGALKEMTGPVEESPEEHGLISPCEAGFRSGTRQVIASSPIRHWRPRDRPTAWESSRLGKRHGAVPAPSGYGTCPALSLSG